jgi:hypothetical protein
LVTSSKLPPALDLRFCAALRSNSWVKAVKTMSFSFSGIFLFESKTLSVAKARIISVRSAFRQPFTPKSSHKEITSISPSFPLSSRYAFAIILCHRLEYLLLLVAEEPKYDHK